MCGIFGAFSKSIVEKEKLETLIKFARRRGRDSSGLVIFDEKYKVYRADYDIKKLYKSTELKKSNFAVGHSRLITNGLTDNQPVVKDDVCLVHNGIIINHDKIWETLSIEREFKIDSEVILGIALQHLKDGGDFDGISNKVLSVCQGQISAALIFPKMGKVILFSNNGSLYVGRNQDSYYFSSEEHPLREIGCKSISQVRKESVILDIPKSQDHFLINDKVIKKVNLIPEFSYSKIEDSILEYENVELKRCTKCILPETMPYIKFDSEGVCNYCKNYTPRNVPKPKEELFELVESYRRNGETDCVVPFSGGRDSCYGLHLIVEELKMKPITYTYDWGMVTDLGRRNISRMCSQMGVENIIVAADITKKRQNIKRNLTAWLKSPHLGMMSILTAGDKHFFRHVETVKKQTGVNLNLWGVNPLEVTHFKTGFLDIPPDFESDKVYTHGALKQLNYQKKRFKAMSKSPGYFNSSLWDTLSGEYYRSFTEKSDYYHIFDYWRWDEEELDNTLINKYDWEKAEDTSTTWRIGDGTAAFYNYVYFTVAGFTEHDTFRSNQIREGDITREKALKLVENENRPRYQNIKWYLDTLNLNFTDVIKIVNSIPKMYKTY